MSSIMLVTMITVWMMIATIVTGKNYKKGQQCYQCAWAPDKLVVRTEKVTIKVPNQYDPYKPKTKVVTRLVSERQSGGWEACEGPFTHYDALDYGIDVWECDDNCMTRVDKNGNVFRGCYRGEYGVDPDQDGCQLHGDSMYCFCEGEKCNNERAPTYETTVQDNNSNNNNNNRQYIVLNNYDDDNTDDNNYGDDDNSYESGNVHGNNNGYDDDNNNSYDNANDDNTYNSNNRLSNNNGYGNNGNNNNNRYNSNNRYGNNNNRYGNNNNNNNGYNNNNSNRHRNTNRNTGYGNSRNNNNNIGYGTSGLQLRTGSQRLLGLFSSQINNNQGYSSSDNVHGAASPSGSTTGYETAAAAHQVYGSDGDGYGDDVHGSEGYDDQQDDSYPKVTKVEVIDTRQYPIRNGYQNGGQQQAH